MRRLVAGAVAVALAVPMAIWALGGEPDFRGSQPPAEIRLPDFSLRDQDGRTVSAADLRGGVALVTFLDTECREACPIVAEQIRAGLELLDAEERERVVAVAISVHPGVDTPEAVDAFLRRHRVDGSLRYLVGSEAELRPAWDAFQIAAAFDTGDVNIHSAPVRIYDRDGVWVSTLHAGADLTPENLANDVRAAG